MIDQSFSLENLRYIYDSQNRMGNNLSELFFPRIHNVYQKIRRRRLKLRRLSPKIKRGCASELEKVYYKAIQNSIAKLIKHKNDLIDSELSIISQTLSQNFIPTCQAATTKINGKQIYHAGNDAETFFLLKHAQHNLAKLYQIKQSDRNLIVNQLRSTLDDNFPKFIIRTDIKSFYESIDRKIILQKLYSDSLLSESIIKPLREILRQYSQLSKEINGIPRGIGISAVLSELFMRDFDKKIMLYPQTIFYARYVDDIIAIFTPHNDLLTTTTPYMDYIENEISYINLELNPDKTLPCDLISPDAHDKFEFLGYQFCISRENVSLKMSQKRYDRYKIRMQKSFERYKIESRLNESKARIMLIKRIKFLCQNMKLIGNKNKIHSGIYYNNQNITDTSQLISLDHYLQHEISHLKPERLRNRLSRLSFLVGFQDKLHCHFKFNEYKDIMKIWEYQG